MTEEKSVKSAVSKRAKPLVFFYGGPRAEAIAARKVHGMRPDAVMMRPADAEEAGIDVPSSADVGGGPVLWVVVAPRR